MLARLRGAGDGTYQLRVSVHPAELGAVDVTATVRHGSIHVVLAPDHAARGTISDALPQLRHHLADAGFSGIDLGLGHPSPEQRDPHATAGAAPSSGPDGEDTAAPADTPPPPRTRSTTAGLDRWL